MEWYWWVLLYISVTSFVAGCFLKHDGADKECGDEIVGTWIVVVILFFGLIPLILGMRAYGYFSSQGSEDEEK